MQIINRDSMLRIFLIGRRLLATLIDFVIVTLFAACAAMAIAWIVVKVRGVPTDVQLAMMYRNVEPGSRALAWYQTVAQMMAPFALAATPAIWWLYDVVFSLRSPHSTPGKWLFRLQTVSKRERPVYVGEAALRSATKIGTLLVLLFIGKPVALVVLIGLLLAIPLRLHTGQFLHDMIPGTNVSNRPSRRSALSAQTA
jgi:uncharacterized RDD family membrane protein YckC